MSQNKIVKTLAALCLSMTVLLVSCQSLPVQSELTDQNYSVISSLEWKNVTSAVSTADFCLEQVPLVCHAARIQLEGQQIAVKTFPDQNTLFDTNTFTSVNTKQFAVESGAVLALNEGPFSGKNGASGIFAMLSNKREMLGTHVVNGVELGRKNSRYGALLLFRQEGELRASVISSQSEEAEEGAEYAFGGYFQIICDGQIQSFVDRKDSRCGAGVSKDGKVLYILVVEGEHKSSSRGCSYGECARMFLEMGAWNALEFDGGGSAEICVDGKSVLTYRQTRIQAGSFGFVN